MMPAHPAQSVAQADFWGRPGLAPLLAALNREGEEARVVGGAVRNALMTLPVEDVDIATTALPDEVMRRAVGAGFKAVPTGIEHGTVTIVVEGQPFEVTTLREDVETDGRRAVVRFGRDWRHDAQRRDFTMNALYAAPDGQVIDLVGGLADIAARRVRFIGTAEARITEDHLRILRLFRFHAAYGHGEVDRDALSAAIRLRAGLGALSRERVRAELLKLLTAHGAPATLATMSDAGLLVPLLGGLPDLAAPARLAALEEELGIAPSAIRRLAALAVRVSEDAERLRERLRLSRHEGGRLLAAAGRLSGDLGPQAARRLIYLLGREAAIDRALIALARLNGRDGARADALRALVDLAGAWEVPRFPLAAADFMALGLQPGPKLGAALARAEALWVEGDFPADSQSLAAIVAAAVKDRATGRARADEIS